MEIDILRLDRARQRDPLRLLAVLRLAELDVVTVGTLLDSHREPSRRVIAEHHVGAAGLAFGIEPERAGEAAFRVFRAADKGAKLAELQRQPSRAAIRAKPRVGARPVLGKEMAAEFGVE